MNGNSKPFSAVSSKKGATLIELVVVMLVCGAVSLLIYQLFNLSFKKTTILIESIPLQQQAALVSEAFCESVRNSNHITAGTATLPPASPVTTNKIITRTSQGDGIDTFIIANNTITLNGEDMLYSSVNHPIVGNTSQFELSALGKSAALHLDMLVIINKDSITIPPSTEEVRCRQ